MAQTLSSPSQRKTIGWLLAVVLAVALVVGLAVMLFWPLREVADDTAGSTPPKVLTPITPTESARPVPDSTGADQPALASPAEPVAPGPVNPAQSDAVQPAN